MTVKETVDTPRVIVASRYGPEIRGNCAHRQPHENEHRDRCSTAAPVTGPGPAATALPLAGASLVVTAVLAVVYEAGLLSIALSALLTLLLVAVASVLYLGYRPRRLPASLLGMAMAAAPAVILATALMTGPAHLGVPITVITTRLAAVAGWWLSLAIMRPLVDRLGSPRMPVWRASLIFAPALIVAGMCAYAWRGGDGATKTAQRFALLFKTEDNAAWVSHAYAMLRNGHLPRTALESEYYTYSSVSSMPGVLADVALRDRPATPTPRRTPPSTSPWPTSCWPS